MLLRVLRILRSAAPPLCCHAMPRHAVPRSAAPRRGPGRTAAICQRRTADGEGWGPVGRALLPALAVGESEASRSTRRVIVSRT